MWTPIKSDAQHECAAKMQLPIPATSTCTRECTECNACVVIIIQLGCDGMFSYKVCQSFPKWFEVKINFKAECFNLVIHEIQPIAEAVISGIETFER